MNYSKEQQGPKAISVKGVTFGFGRKGIAGLSPVLKKVSFEISSGEVVGILGPNGSGKSTLLKTLMGIFVPQDGIVEMFGQPYASLRQGEISRKIAFVPQETQQVFPFTINEMVLMGRYPHHNRTWGLGWEDTRDRAIAIQAMEDLNVFHLRGRLITDVSSGERQRAVIARALAQEPDVLLLDEPTAFLDLHHQLEIMKTVRRLNQDRGLTVILVSHDLNLASQYCDRVLLFKEGEIAKIGYPQEVICREHLEFVFGCAVIIDSHPQSGMPRMTLPV